MNKYPAVTKMIEDDPPAVITAFELCPSEQRIPNTFEEAKNHCRDCEWCNVWLQHRHDVKISSRNEVLQRDKYGL